jgi:hypothetical protein
MGRLGFKFLSFRAAKVRIKAKKGVSNFKNSRYDVNKK